MKRPWTKGPWKGRLFELLFSDYSKLSPKEQSANHDLAKNSPEMAELLIYFVDTFDGLSFGITQSKIDEIKQLLNECGYNESTK